MILTEIDGEQIQLEQLDGAETCPMPCADCADGKHHWLADSVDLEDPEGVEYFTETYRRYPDEIMLAHYRCKHCLGLAIEVEETR